MKNRTYLISMLALACAVIWGAISLAFPFSATAGTTTTLLSESFSSTSFPPAGWTAGPRNYGTSQPCSYGTQPGWYRSSGNPGGVAGVGSAVCWTFGGYSYNCYGTPSYGPCTLTTPSMNLSGVAVSGDSQYVDFDVYLAASYYDYYAASYSNYMGHIVEVLNGSTVIKTLKCYGTSGGDWTVYTGRSGLCLSDPSAYNSTIYWKHFHLPLGSQTGSMQLTFRVKMQTTSCYYSYWYSENVAVTNVVVKSVHYDMLTMNGPAALDFGRIPYQTPSPVKYTVFTNNSIRPINLSNIQIVGAQSADYTIAYMPTSVAVGTSDSIGIVFSPQGSGVRLATLQFNTDADVPTSVSIPLTGYGLQPTIALPQGMPAVFSQVRVRFGDSATRTFVFRNTGEVPLHVNVAGSGFSGDNPQFYSVARWPAPSIPGGASDSIVFAFTPYVEGLLSAQFNLASDANNGTQTINLRGIGILPHLVVTTNSTSGGSSITGVVNFGQVAIGDSICQTLTVHNTGSDTLKLQKQIVTYGDYDFTFTLLSGTDVNLPPDASKLVNVCFKPLQRGVRLASLRLYTNISPMYPGGGDSSQYLIQVTGNGVPYGKLALSGQVNDSAIVGSSNCINDTIWNTGAADLTISSAKLTGANASDFALSGATFPLIIPAGQFKALQVCYSPTVRGLSNASLDLVGTSSDRTMNQSLPILGVGQVVCMDATPNPVAFGSAVYPSMTLAKTGHDTAHVRVSNCGDVAMTFTPTLTNSLDSAYALLTNSVTVAPQGNATIDIAYNPVALGASTGAVTITSNQSSLTPVTLPLSGQGAGVLVDATGQPANTMVGDSSTFLVTLTNNGNVTWTPGAVTVAGADFSSTGTVAPIPAGGQGTISVTYAPKAVGTSNGSISFANAAPMPLNSTLPYSFSASALANAGVAMHASQDGFVLGASYPNPATNTATVNVTMPHSAKVSVSLVRVDGSQVASVYDGMLSGGQQTLTLDLKQVASGTYFCVLQSGDVKVMREIVVLK